MLRAATIATRTSTVTAVALCGDRSTCRRNRAAPLRFAHYAACADEPALSANGSH
jgi:hypothetical protein